ncbi:MAG: ABC transporter ATP-binding protein [Candidatus Brockarchaeota archaeon]|nr:ABC transporter ATP-binding protein [Candidatus Brockarchaeota archaeon]MBO3801933.1 ABC transporter ATP-binding protein [Candidatus Brockarchaeota archaeon]
MQAIETIELTKKFGNLVAVDKLSFEVEKGEIFGILGPNGAGKTTTIRLLACLLSPSSGSANVGGFDIVKDSMKVREIVGIQTENPSLYERLTAYENLDFFAEAYGILDSQERRKRIRDLLDFFGLWVFKDKKVGAFSRGMKQKLSIARAIVHDPDIIFLDEPTSGLDPESAREIKDLMKSFSRKGKTIVFSTHVLGDAEKLCNRVMIISKGKRVALGALEELLTNTSKPILRITLKKLDQRVIDAIKCFKQVKEVTVADSSSVVSIVLDDVETITPEIIKSVVLNGGLILSVNVVNQSLEDVYLKIVRGGKVEN